MSIPGPARSRTRGAARSVSIPGVLDAIVLTHKHLDHSGDVNAMIEAMTQGGTKKRGPGPGARRTRTTTIR